MHRAWQTCTCLPWSPEQLRGTSVLLCPPGLNREQNHPGCESCMEVALVKVKVAQSCPTLCDPGTIQSMEFFRPEHRSVWPYPFPEDLSIPGIEPRSPALQADSLPAEPPGAGEPMARGLGPAPDCRCRKGDIQPSALPSGLRDGTLSFRCKSLQCWVSVC
ncbi:unnamed protein product [Rangifer tarandus platyrhynchus]|uniref:Uncharacterized protein n=2 Tax=Rangifer tarandus platyrhynchus TaxID=3082113 RepID=A0AC59ZZ24_RANTA|nr:unnamed protein product [Rangifer tarandus platyrhynchus]